MSTTPKTPCPKCKSEEIRALPYPTAETSIELKLQGMPFLVETFKAWQCWKCSHEFGTTVLTRRANPNLPKATGIPDPKEPKTASAKLYRFNEDGTLREIIDLTPEEVQEAPQHYGENDCCNILVYSDNGDRYRPYRFVDAFYEED